MDWDFNSVVERSTQGSLLPEGKSISTDPLIIHLLLSSPEFCFSEVRRVLQLLPEYAPLPLPLEPVLQQCCPKVTVSLRYRVTLCLPSAPRDKVHSSLLEVWHQERPTNLSVGSLSTSGIFIAFLIFEMPFSIKFICI